MTNTIRQPKFVVFDEASIHDERMAAVLITKDSSGNLRAFVKDVPGREQPDPEIVAALVQSVEIANL